MTFRKIKEIDDSMPNAGPRTNRTSRTINAASVASKRKSILDDYNDTEKSPARGIPTESQNNIFIMDHIEELMRDIQLQESINELRVNLGLKEVDFTNFDEVREIPQD